MRIERLEIDPKNKGILHKYDSEISKVELLHKRYQKKLECLLGKTICILNILFAHPQKSQSDHLFKYKNGEVQYIRRKHQ